MSISRAVAAEWAKGWPKIVEGQKSLKASTAFIHRKRGDLVTSKVIPLAMSAVGTVLLVPGLFSMYLGINKNE